MTAVIMGSYDGYRHLWHATFRVIPLMTAIFREEVILRLFAKKKDTNQKAQIAKHLKQMIATKDKG